MGGGLQLGAADVRPAAEKVGGDADGYLQRGLRDGGAVAQQVIEVAGRHAQQDAEGIFGLPEGSLELGDNRLGASQLGDSLLYVPTGAGPGLETGLGDPQAFFLNVYVFLCDPQAFFDCPNGHIGARHLGREAHEGIVVGGNGAEEACILGLDRAPELPPEIDFPAGRRRHLGLLVFELVCRRPPLRGRRRPLALPDVQG